MSVIRVKTEEEWHQLRDSVITATQAPCIFGLNPWKSAAKMWEEKFNSTFEGNSYTQLGHWLEPVVVEITNHFLGTEFNLYEQNGKAFFIADDLKLGATPDAGDGKQLLECKSTGPHNALRWAYSPPLHYAMQLYIQLYCTGLHTGYLSILGTNLSQKDQELRLPLSIFKLTREPEIDKIVIKEMMRFWDTVDRKVMFRTNRKRSDRLKWLLKFNLEKLV